MKLNSVSFKPILPLAIATLFSLTACNEIVEDKPKHPETSTASALPQVADEIAKAEDRVLTLLLDEPSQTEAIKRVRMMSHPGRDTLIRFLEERSNEMSRSAFHFDDEYEFTDAEEAMIDDFLETQPEVEEAIEDIIKDFDSAFADLDKLPLEIEVPSQPGEETKLITLYPVDGYYYVGSVEF